MTDPDVSIFQSHEVMSQDRKSFHGRSQAKTMILHHLIKQKKVKHVGIVGNDEKEYIA